MAASTIGSGQRGVTAEANLAYCDVDGFVDDFMVFCLEGEHEFLLGFFPWSYALSRRRSLVQEISQ
jgi:hypothetical protein